MSRHSAFGSRDFLVLVPLIGCWVYSGVHLGGVGLAGYPGAASVGLLFVTVLLAAAALWHAFALVLAPAVFLAALLSDYMEVMFGGLTWRDPHVVLTLGLWGALSAAVWLRQILSWVRCTRPPQVGG